MARAKFVAALVLAVFLLLASPAYAGVTVAHQPSWVELTLEQQRMLDPLKNDWDKLELMQRKKWIAVSRRYPKMVPHEQQRIQQRMVDWARLAPEQRKKAREQYKSLQKAPPAQKKIIHQKWQEYSSLPKEEQQRLANPASSQK